MPMYEYKCDNCKKVHEMIQKFSDPVLTECPVCKGPVEKLMSMNSFALKGSGWYTTDYRRSSCDSGGKSDNSGCGTGGCQNS